MSDEGTTSRETAESLERLLNSRQLKTIFEVLPGGVSIATDPSCQEIIHNPIAAEYFRIQPWTSLSCSRKTQQFRVTYQGEEILPADMPIQRAAQKGEHVTGFELETVWEDGVRKTALWSARPLYDNNGCITGAIGTFEDITEKRRVQEELLEHRNRLELMVIAKTERLRAAHEKISDILESITDGFFALDASLRIVYANRQAAAAIAVDKTKVLGMRFDELFPYENEWQKAFELVLKTNEPLHQQLKGIASEKWYNLSVYPKDSGVSVYFRDVTKHRSAAVKLKTQADMLDLAHDCIIAMDFDYKIIYWNHGAEICYGWTREEALGQKSYELLKSRFPQAPELISQTLHISGHWAGEVKQQRRDGSELMMDSHWTLARDKSGNSFAIFEISHDITQKKLLEERLKSREEEYKTLLDNTPDVIIRYDRSYRYLYVNREIMPLSRTPVVEIIGKNWDDLKHPQEIYAVWKQYLDEVFNTGKPLECEQALIDWTGKVKVYGVHIVPETGRDGSINTALVILRDITDKKQTEERFYKAFHTNPAMMAIISLEDGKYVDANESFLAAVGYTCDEVIGKTSDDINLWADNAKSVAREALIRQGRLRNFEFRYRTKTGEVRIGLLSGDTIMIQNKMCSLMVIIDITEKQRLEMEMARLDRLNLVGEMAAGIAHEVRNPLTTVRGYLQLFFLKEDFSSHTDHLRTMIDELDRANSIITEYLSLAKNKTVEFQNLDLNDIIGILLPLLEADALCLGHTVQAKLGVVPNLLLDEKEIRQLILNLVRNAFEAMKEGGVVSIKTRCPQNKVILSIEDNGPGIPASVLSKLGTPFVSTKDGGTGLGLAVCFRIADRHGAKIKVRTSSKGSNFSVIFPI